MRPLERELAYVPRWSIVRTIRRQSVAEHAFFVTRYAIEIATATGMNPTSTFIQYCLEHDDEELHSGDIPSPFKKALGMESTRPINIGEQQWTVLKIADLLESVLFLIDEQLLGNKTVEVIIEALKVELKNLSKNWYTTSGEELMYWLNVRIDLHRTYAGRTA